MSLYTDEDLPPKRFEIAVAIFDTNAEVDGDIRPKDSIERALKVMFAFEHISVYLLIFLFSANRFAKSFDFAHLSTILGESGLTIVTSIASGCEDGPIGIKISAGLN